MAIFDIDGNIICAGADVKSLGAKGDGITDDSDILNSAFANYKRVYLPTGTYLVSKTIVIPSGVEVFGDGIGSVLKLSSSFNLTGYPWRDSYKYPIVEVDEGCVLKDFLVNGDETQARDQGQVGILIHGDDCFCENVSTKNINYFPNAWIGGESGYGTVNAPGYGIFIFGSNNTFVSGGSFDGNGYQGIGIESSDYAKLVGCYVGDGNRTGIQVHRYSKNVTISNCIVNNANVHKHADLTMHGTNDDYIADVSVIGCKFVSNGEEKATLQTVWGYEKNIIISGCLFNSTNKCISICHDRTTGDETANGIVITNNILKSLADGIKVRGDKCVVVGNLITCTGTDVNISGTHKTVANNLTT